MAKTVTLWVLKVLGFLVLAPALLWGSTKLHVPTAMGRAAAKDAINELASSKLRGRLHVDSVDVLREDHIELTGFSAFDLDDVEVLAIGHAVADVDISAAVFGNAIRLSNVQGYDVDVVLRDGKNSKVSISDVFESKNPSQSSGPSRDLDFGWMWAENADLDIRMASRPLGFRIANASVSVTRQGEQPIHIDIRGADGAMTRPSILDIGLRFVGASGRIRPKTDEVLRLNTGACIGNEPMQLRVVYRPGPPKVARVILDYESGLGFLMSLGFRVGDLISGPLEVDERELPGDPPSNCEGRALGGSGEDSDSGDEGSDSEDDPGDEDSDSADSDSSDGSGSGADSDSDVDEDTDEDNDENVDERLEDADDQLDEALEAAGGL